MATDREQQRLAAQRDRKFARARRETAWFEAVGRHLPFGLKRRLAAISAKLGLLLAGDGDIVVDDYLGRFRIHVLATNPTERAMLAGSHEREIVKLIKSRVRLGHVCFDIGANVGALTLPMSEAAGSNGRVYSFEPGEKFYNRLRANLALNPTVSSRVEPHMVGLSDTPQRMQWHEDPLFPGNGWLLGGIGEPVEVTTVDAFVAANRIERLDFIKIDVEGMEIEVLNGARTSLARFRPTIVLETLMAFEAIRRRPIRKEAETLLLGLDYEIFGIDRWRAAAPVRHPDLPANCLAVPREIAG